MSELFRQFAADSARIRPYPRGVRRRPPNVRRTFGGVRRKIFLADVRRIRAEPGGVRAFPRGFGRNRGGRSSAEPIAVSFRQTWNFIVSYHLLNKTYHLLTKYTGIRLYEIKKARGISIRVYGGQITDHLHINPLSSLEQ